MSKRNLRAEDEDGFIRAFNDETRDTELTYDVRIVWQLCKGRDANALYLRGTAHKADENDCEQVWAHTEYRYPTHRTNRLYAALYAAAIALNVVCQHKHREQTGDWYSSALTEPAKVD